MVLSMYKSYKIHFLYRLTGIEVPSSLAFGNRDSQKRWPGWSSTKTWYRSRRFPSIKQVADVFRACISREVCIVGPTIHTRTVRYRGGSTSGEDKSTPRLNEIVSVVVGNLRVS